AAALGDVQSAIEDGYAAKIIVLPGFIRRVGLTGGRLNDLSDFEVADFIDAGGHGRRLAGNEQLGAGGRDEFLADGGRGGLLLGEVSAVVVSDHVIHAVAPLERAAAIISTIGVALGDLEVAVGIHFRHRAVVLPDSSIRRVNEARGVAVGYIEDVWAGRESRAAAVAHERDGLSVRGEVYGQLRFRTEAGDNLIGGNRQSIQQMAVGRDVVQEDGRRYAKVAVGRAVVEDGRIRGIGSWRGAGDRYRRRAPGDERNVDRSRH